MDKRQSKLATTLTILMLGLAFTIGTADAARSVEVERKTLNLKVSGSEMVETSHPVRRASVANPEVADIMVLSPHELYTYGKQVGYTSVILWEEGGGRTLLDVVVQLDLTSLKEKLHELFPDEPVNVYASETGVVLSGTVSGPDVMDQVLRLTRTYLPVLAQGDQAGMPGTGVSGSGITNLLRVGGVHQVMLEVKFAEVSRASNKDWKAMFGIENLSTSAVGAAGTGVLGAGDLAFLANNPGSLLLNFAESTFNVFANIDNVTVALNFLETEGLARTLAEPRLVTQSGQEASFLAGGEFPVPVAQDLGEISLEYKDFGVSLVFTPVVMSDGRINLRVAPTVSEIAGSTELPSGIGTNTFIMPNLNTRRLETTVQLYDGQTLALAGLLQDSLREEVDKIPGLGDLPILGPFFRSSSYKQNKTDLLIAVTPHLVKPVKEGDLSFPGEYMQPPSPYEFYLEGRLEGTRTGDEPSALSSHDYTQLKEKRGGLEGDFGHQPPM